MELDRNRMAELHEIFLAELNGGRKSKSSGSQWTDQGDGRGNELTEEFAFAWDGKATRGKSITIDRAIIAKIREQAAGERPQIGLRWYGSDDLQEVDEDWIAIPAADYAELLAAARSAVHFSGPATVVDEQRAQELANWATQGARNLAQPPPTLHGMYPAYLPPPPHAMWPCLVVDARHGTEEPDTLGLESDGYHVASDGVVTRYGVSSVRYDMGMGYTRLYVNDVLVHSGQLYIDGALRLTVGPSSLNIA